jgi:Mg2+/Co2+ transporter CorB
MEEHIAFHLPLGVAVPLVVLCLALGAYMSAAETAITGASRPRMHRLAQQGNKRAAMVNGLLDRKDEVPCCSGGGVVTCHSSRRRC